MTEKQFIEMLKNIKEHCIERDCPECRFKISDYCQLRLLGEEFYNTPTNWNIEKIEELLNE